jgi:hypothetical protein
VGERVPGEPPCDPSFAVGHLSLTSVGRAERHGAADSSMGPSRVCLRREQSREGAVVEQLRTLAEVASILNVGTEPRTCRITGGSGACGRCASAGSSGSRSARPPATSTTTGRWPEPSAAGR